MSRGVLASTKTGIGSLIYRLVTIITIGEEIDISLIFGFSSIHKQNTVFSFHVQFSYPFRAEKVFDLDLVYEVIAGAAIV